LQNLEVSGFSEWHLGHFTALFPYYGPKISTKNFHVNLREPIRIPLVTLDEAILAAFPENAVGLKKFLGR
jgi:hypothetical protein